MDILLLKAFTNSSTICTCSLVNLSDCIELEFPVYLVVHYFCHFFNCFIHRVSMSLRYL